MTTQQQPRAREAVRHVEVTEERAGQRLDNFLMRLLEKVPRSHVYRLVRRGEVRVNGRRASPEQRLQWRDKVRVPPVHVEPPASGPRSPPPRLLERIRAAVIHEDSRLIVVDKPPGIATHGGSGVSFGVIETLRALYPGQPLDLVHRLDRDTSGCLLIARKPATLRALHALLREGHFQKGYLALLKGHWNLGHKRIDAPLRTDLRVSGERTVRVHATGKQAVSEFRPVQFFGKQATLVEVALFTGRTHQIRVHAAHAGHPVAGDAKYGDADFNLQMRTAGLERMFLHAHSVSFTWPQGGEFSASAPLPPDLRSLLDELQSRSGARRRRHGSS
ncbi:MAG TPA: RluA family pseudouridine synthase [Steroidobacteraceae bacterium]|nr:RluA family pseudouridine synthase [Steroidobacteraceae bacterium]